MELRDYLLSLDENNLDAKELEYRQNDPVRKFQIDYDRTVCLTEKFPEAFYIEIDKSTISAEFSVAPGEGKLPENIPLHQLILPTRQVPRCQPRIV